MRLNEQKRFKETIDQTRPKYGNNKDHNQIFSDKLEAEESWLLVAIFALVTKMLSDSFSRDYPLL